MVNIKWGFIAGIAAFIFSFATGLIAGVNILHVFLRALLFLAVFFCMGLVLRLVISIFLPELFIDSDESRPQSETEYPGRRINISVGSSGEYAVPNSANSSDEYELGNVEDLVSGIFKPGNGAIDLDGEDEYNNQGGGVQSGSSADDLDFSDFNPYNGGSNNEEKPAFSPGFAESGLSGLPDLDAMAAVFSGGSTFAPDNEPAQEYSADTGRATLSGRNKPQPLKGDFDAKELAKGISTVLSKDK
ncbi:MAG: hypothetical protein LBB81_03605 [Treponema sp.]|nr:hypothetical protein [Treponema sp.]